MSGGVEIWAVRHGETEWSRGGAHTGRTDVALTDVGREQARRVGAFLAGRSFDAVLTSPLARARDTCALAGYGVVAVADEDLLEWDYGAYEGKTTTQIRVDFPGWTVWKDAVPGGETVDAVGVRADAVIARVLEVGASASADKPKVLLFAHAHILRILAARWMGLEAAGGRLFTLSTGSLSRLGWERETRVVAAWNWEFEK